MEFLFSNYPPMKTGCKTFADTFYGLLPQTTKLDIAVGYVSSDALIELQKTIELNSNIRTLNLIVGMHYFDHFTKVQYDTAMNLNDFLVRNQLGGVRLVNAFRYHGKLYSYSNDAGPFAGIVGSNNLSSIVDSSVRVYESSVLLRDKASAKQMNDFISRLTQTSTRNIAELQIDTFNDENALLDGHEFVEKVSPQNLANVMCAKTAISFEIPTIIFVNGCFWHMHGCSRSRLPRSNEEYWKPKIERNIKRDAENKQKLEVAGWNVIIVWECELKKRTSEERLSRLCNEIRNINRTT